MDIPSFSTSSSDSNASWKRFVRVSFSALLLLPPLCYAFLLAMDPYDNLPFSPKFNRVPVDKMQRLFHPELARKTHFDSAVIGTSNIRLLRPEQLNQVLDGSFVNLGMDAASSWEQQQFFNVFTRNHQQINTVIFGIDYLWCYAKYAEQKFVGANTAAAFPHWMYDENIDNNLPPLNAGSLKHAWRLLLAVSGVKASEFGRDGYTVFTNPMSDYRLDKARIEIYGSIEPKKKKPVRPPKKMTSRQKAKMPIPALQRLEAMMVSLPKDTKKILLFVPYHNYYQAREGSKQAIVWGECKKRVVALAASMNSTYVLDFMIPSPITKKDTNYWDYKHYTVEVAEILTPLIGKAVSDGVSNPNYRLLYPVPR
jgi:hypothetical protein